MHFPQFEFWSRSDIAEFMANLASAKESHATNNKEFAANLGNRNATGNGG
jgi:hypothetical protein